MSGRLTYRLLATDYWHQNSTRYDAHTIITEPPNVAAALAEKTVTLIVCVSK